MVNEKVAMVWCTYGYAAALLGVSVRTVARYVDNGILPAATPQSAPSEDMRHKRMLEVKDVERLAAARKLVFRA